MSHSHSSRLAWLKERGFLSEDRSTNLPDLGTCLWVDGNKGHRQVSLWLGVRDGSAVVHGINKGTMSWDELQAWIEPPPEVAEVVKPLKGQKSLWGDDDGD